jgi:hypothetical protein
MRRNTGLIAGASSEGHPRMGESVSRRCGEKKKKTWGGEREKNIEKTTETTRNNKNNTNPIGGAPKTD